MVLTTEAIHKALTISPHLDDKNFNKLSRAYLLIDVHISLRTNQIEVSISISCTIIGNLHNDLEPIP
jgi:hypothetical protein